jgi:hypothetical protein
VRRGSRRRARVVDGLRSCAFARDQREASCYTEATAFAGSSGIDLIHSLPGISKDTPGLSAVAEDGTVSHAPDNSSFSVVRWPCMSPG